MPPIPVLVKVLVVFVLVVLAASRKVNLGIAALAGGWAFSLWQGFSVGGIAERTVREVLDPETLLMMLLVIAIVGLSTAMKKAGAMEGFARSVLAVASSRNAAIMLTPALVGTLPMPGGAAFSAPLVDSLDPGRSLGAERLSTANFWFRHSLELWWPLFPAFILTSSLSGLPVPRLVLLNLYTLPMMMILGKVFILKGGKGRKNSPEGPVPEKAPPGWGAVFSGLAPLLVTLGAYGVLDAAWRIAGIRLIPQSDASRLAGRFLPILLGVAAGALYVGLRNPGRKVFRGAVDLAALKLAGLVAGIRVFSALLEAGGAASAAATELAAAGIPPLAVAVLLPLVSGLVTGIGFGYVGLSLPIVLGLFHGGAFGSLGLEPVVVLAGASGFAGMMVSPLHVCMVVSAEHFTTALSGMLRRLAAPIGVFLVLAIGYVAVLARVFRIPGR